MRVRRVGLGVVLGVMVAVSAVAAPAAARIVPFESIAGFELGMPEAELREALGKPSRVRETGIVGMRTLVYRRRKLEFGITEDRVTSIETSSRRHKTSNGVGPGTKLRVLRGRLRGERCTTANRQRLCTTQRGQLAMSYIIRRDRVASVMLSGGPSAAK